MLLIYLSMLESEDEKQSFADFYARVKHKCLRVALSITKDQTLAEDVLHDAFVNAIKIKNKIFSLSRYKQDSLVVIMVRNRAIDIMRKERKPNVEYFDDLADNYYDHPPQTVDVVADYESIETYERLIRLINSLPEIYEIVLEMKYIQELSNDEIARILDMEKNAVAVRLTRARNKLAEMMKGGEQNG